MLQNCKSSILLLFITSLSMYSCGIYSFKQGTIAADVQTISIANIYNEIGGGPPNLGQIFTEKLKIYYQQNSKLKIEVANGDWRIDGKIISYQSTGIAPQGNRSEINRLTITLQVKFINTTDEKSNFDQSFTYFEDYDKNSTLTLVENELVQKISDQIVLDVFNKTTSNW